MASAQDGNLVKPKQIWKQVGPRDNERPLQNQDMGVVNQPNLCREAILWEVRKRREELQVEPHTVLFVAPSGELYDKVLAPSEEVQSADLALQVDNGAYPENQVQRNCGQEWSGSWFEITEDDIDEEPVVVSAKRSPRSLLKLVDEALEFELGCLAERRVLGVEDYDDEGAVC